MHLRQGKDSCNAKVHDFKWHKSIVVVFYLHCVFFFYFFCFCFVSQHTVLAIISNRPIALLMINHLFCVYFAHIHIYKAISLAFVGAVVGIAVAVFYFLLIFVVAISQCIAYIYSSVPCGRCAIYCCFEVELAPADVRIVYNIYIHVYLHTNLDRWRSVLQLMICEHRCVCVWQKNYRNGTCKSDAAISHRPTDGPPTDHRQSGSRIARSHRSSERVEMKWRKIGNK